MTKSDATPPDAPTGIESDDRTAPLSRPPRETGWIGPYRLVRELGRGGMGVVYEAEQSSPRRMVALKVLQAGLAVDEGRVRLFQREIAALARLKHPGIAAIYEAGLSEDGRHFFAMELVRGQTLSEHLVRGNREAPLPPAAVRGRIRLFLRVCDAVAYAHQRGIIHRDLKPANIVVLPEGSDSGHSQDHGPQVKVLDFGLARIADAELAGEQAASVAGEVFGTLPYMSPEQFSGNPDEVDTRTDVYALGVILFEMLAGRQPHPLRGVSLTAAAQLIGETTAPALGRDWIGQGTPDPDLRTIVAKALEKEAHRRYASVAALAEDLDRFLRCEPIAARPASAFYQLRKLFARHRLTFGGALGAVLLLVLSTIGLSTFSARLAAERRRAEREAARAQAINDFLVGLLQSANPVEGRSKDVTVLETLRAAEQKVEAAFPGEPDVRGRVLYTIGTTYYRLGDYREAEPLLRASVRAWQVFGGAEELNQLEPLCALALLRQERGDLAEGERILRQALELKRRHRPRPDQAELDILNNLGNLLVDKGQLGEAESLLAQVVAHDRAQAAGRPRDLAASLNNFGRLRMLQGRSAEAEALFRECVQLLAGAPTPERAVIEGNLGEAMVAQGRLAEGLARLGSAAAGGVAFGEDSQDLAMIRVKLAEGLLKSGRPAEAEAAARPAHRVLHAGAGAADPRTRRAARALVEALAGQGRTAEAAALR